MVRVWLTGQEPTVKRFRYVTGAGRATAAKGGRAVIGWGAPAPGQAESATAADGGRADTGWVEPVPGHSETYANWIETLAEAAQEAAGRPADPGPADGPGAPFSAEDIIRTLADSRAAVDSPRLPISPWASEEREKAAWEAAHTINHTLARLFVQLGPPPEGAGGTTSPVTSDGGGAQQ